MKMVSVEVIVSNVVCPISVSVVSFAPNWFNPTEIGSQPIERIVRYKFYYIDQRSLYNELFMCQFPAKCPPH